MRFGPRAIEAGAVPWEMISRRSSGTVCGCSAFANNLAFADIPMLSARPAIEIAIHFART